MLEVIWYSSPPVNVVLTDLIVLYGDRENKTKFRLYLAAAELTFVNPCPAS